MVVVDSLTLQNSDFDICQHLKFSTSYISRMWICVYIYTWICIYIYIETDIQGAACRHRRMPWPKRCKFLCFVYRIFVARSSTKPPRQPHPLMCQPWQLDDRFLSIERVNGPILQASEYKKRIIWLAQWELGVISFLVAVVMHGSINWNPDIPHAHSCELHHGQSSSNLLSGLFEFEPSVKQTKCHGLTVVLRWSFVPKASCQRHDTLQAPPQSTQRWVVDLKHLRGSTLVQWTGNSNRQAFKLRHTILLLRFDFQVRPRRTGEFLIFVVLIWRLKNY